MLKRTLSTVLALAVFASQTAVLASENAVSNVKITGAAEVGKSLGVTYDLADGAEAASVNWLVSAPGDDEWYTTDATGESFVVDYSQMGMGIKAKVTSGEYSSESEAVNESISGLVHVNDDFSSSITGYNLSDNSLITRDETNESMKITRSSSVDAKATKNFTGVSGKVAFAMKVKNENNAMTSQAVIEGSGGCATIITYKNKKFQFSVLNAAGTGNETFTAPLEYASGVYHLLSGTFDTDSDTFSMFIDGKKVFDEKKFRTPNADIKTISRIYVQVPKGSADGCANFDNINFRNVYPIPECDAPAVSAGSISGVNKLNSTLGIDYTYTDPADYVEFGTTVNWYQSAREDGIYTKIENVSSKNLVISDAFAGRYIKAGIVPSNIWGVKGAEFMTASISPKNILNVGLSDSFDAIPEKNFTIKKGTAGASVTADGSLNAISDGTINPEMTYVFTKALNGKSYVDFRLKTTGGSGLVYVQGGAGAGVKINIDGAANLKVNDKVVASGVNNGNWFDVKIVVTPVGNTTDGAVDVYINGVKKATGLALKAAITNLSNVFIAKTAAGTLSIDDINIYTIDTNGGVLDNGVAWKYNTANKTLTISGNGVLPDYSTADKTKPEWYENRDWNHIATAIEKLVVEEGISGIGSNCFRGASKLTSVTLPSTCKSINAYAFTRSGITTINLPEGLETIADGAFANVLTLKEITFPKSVKSINKFAFNNSTGNTCILETVYAYQNTAGQDFAELWNINYTLLDVITVKYDAAAKAATINAPEVTVATVIFAVHSASGLKEVKLLEDEFLLEGENIIDDQGITVGEGDTVSVFVWDGISTLVPLATAERVLPVNYTQYSVNSYFSDNMVLQRGSKIPVCGMGPTGGSVRVTLDDTTKTAVVTDNKWSVEFDAMEADGKEHTLIVGAEGFVKTFKNIAIGDVYLASGQSNMALTMGILMSDTYSDDVNEMTAKEVEKAGEYTDLRLYRMRSNGDLYLDEPEEEPRASWVVSNSTSVKNFTAIGYYFGKKINQSENIPVGIVQSAINGTKIQQWMDDETIKNENVDVQGTDSMYNALIHPFAKFPFKAVLWYQGESNYNDVENYGRYMTALVNSWRDNFNDSDLPFLYVQLPSFDTWDYRGIRDVQLELSQTLSNVGMIAMTDGGEATEIHPWDKETVAERLAVLARGMFYGYDKEYRCPIVEAVEYNGAEATVVFKYEGEGLKTADGGALKGFELCGSDGVYKKAAAEITSDNTVKVSADGIDKATGVRYSYEKMMTGNLYNSENLPAAPFGNK